MNSQSWMATLLFTLIAFAGGFLAGLHGTPTPATGQPLLPKAPAPNVSAHFSPQGGCTNAVVDEIASARRTVEVESRTLTSARIADALAAAARRGVHVTVLLDAAQASEHREQVRYLVGERIPVMLDARHGLADNRLILIDNHTLLTGSFDFSDIAEQGNAANLLILRDQPQIQSLYEDNFRSHLAHAQPYDGG
jgi:phosphatidylserine/phosphatidylglycerophosphate/cardiolipin synthase-like enzyme